MTEKIAVLLPCYNEEKTIAQVVADFRTYLPQAEIYVYDNNSTDDTARLAREAGAIVRSESLQGKGNVVRRMFADIEADVYLMSDGDQTYDISRAPELVALIGSGAYDMAVGARQECAETCYRAGHRFGNTLLTGLVQQFFSHRLKDMLSGYRCFSRRYVKTFPARSVGFEIETELTVYALSARLPMIEIDTAYYPRPSGSVSKLSTYRDGIRILTTIVRLVKEERPLLFFSLISMALLLLAIGISVPLLIEYFESGLVPRFPTAILVTGMVTCAVICFLTGLVLDSVSAFRQEARRQAYLRYAPL